MTNRITPSNIISLKETEVFVFGSNEQGNHVAGAAKMAKDNFGAIIGKGFGVQGQSYAINSMSGIDVLKEQINYFIVFASYHIDLIFLVTEIGCGIAGYTPNEVAPLFKQAMHLPNIHLPKSFWNVLNSLTI